ncbi:MAG: methylase [Bacteroidaceae bacterium]|nr:methylase [Bacteroidaceae bacterium]
MGWMRATCGRLKSDYSYSNTIVYNNFPWPTPTDEQRKMIEQTAHGILEARAMFPESTLADLYSVAMPSQLIVAHQANDRAVMAAYGWKASRSLTESTCVAELFKMYQELTK